MINSLHGRKCRHTYSKTDQKTVNMANHISNSLHPLVRIAYRQLDFMDLPGIKAVADECFPTSDFTEEWYCEVLTGKGSYAHGAFDQETGEMVGMIMGETQCVLDAEDDVGDPILGGSITAGKDNMVYIPIFGVLEPYRRFGIGSNLMKKFLFHAETNRHTKAIYLHVESCNHVAILFYEKMGFQYFKKILGYYYVEHDDALVYVAFVNGGKQYIGGARDVHIPAHMGGAALAGEQQQSQKLKNSSAFKKSVSVVGVPVIRPLLRQISK